MNELLTVVLVCASTIAPSECSRMTAADVATRPARTPFDCAKQGQVIPAEAGLIGPGQYLKIVCEHRKVAAAQPTEN